MAKKTQNPGFFPDFDGGKKKKEDSCPICEIAAENPKEARALLELLTLCSNATAAFFLSQLSPEPITNTEIVNHKKHMKEWAGPFHALPKLYHDLDLSRTEDMVKLHVLDSVQARLLYPGKTSPYAAMQGLKLIMDAEAAAVEDDSDSYVAGVVKIVLDHVKDPVVRREIAEALQKWQDENEEGNK